MIWNIAEGDARIFIYKIYFALLIITLLFAFLWVKIIKKADAFRPVSLDEINDVKLENQAEDSQTPASLLVNLNRLIGQESESHNSPELPVK